MSDIQFTPDQQDCINASGGSILVSAAAGSGKTRVLVSRVSKKITDPVAPVSADRMLIMTYTKTAAAEMIERISKDIEELLVKNPKNENLLRQQMLLQRADISTIHSFCSKIIRENFYLLDINKDFRIGEEEEMSVIRHSIMADIIEERYSSQEEAFIILSEILSGSKSDKFLEDTFLNLYDKAISHPYPEEWLERAVSVYSPEVKLRETHFVKIALEKLSLSIDFMFSLLEKAEEIIENHADFQKDIKTSGINALQNYQLILKKLKDCLKEDDIDSIIEIFLKYQKPAYRKPTGKNVSVDDETCEILKGCFDTIHDTLSEDLLPFFSCGEEDFKRDNQQLYPVVCCLKDITLEFIKRYARIKNEKNVFDFSDLEHFMLELLLKRKDGEWVRTELAEELSEKYEEIMIDEYQDTNEIQERIFRALSRNEQNLFTVGDVKQSIYRFREAVPKIFTARREACVRYNSESPKFPAKIILGENFRSRQGIIESVNFVFEKIMSKRVGEVDYNEQEKLIFGAKYYPESSEPEVEFHILENSSEEDGDSEEWQELSMYQMEAVHIVEIINKMMEEDKIRITDKDEKGNIIQRKVKYGDFCILMRALSGHSSVYSNTLNNSGIPAYTDKPYSLLGCYEVNIALSFLKVIDNPLNDIALLGVMLCPIFGFTTDEISIIKTTSDLRHIYSCLIDHIENQRLENYLHEKCKNFYQILSEFRMLAVTVSTDRLLETFFERTGFISVMGAMKNGSARIKNLRKFLYFARKCEEYGRNGLTAFIRYVNRLEENGTEIGAADMAPADSVRIMTIHHSKGLEFPICILAATNARKRNQKDTILCHSDLGIGINTIDRENMLKFPSFQKSVIMSEIAREEKSEEMRVLYVAMTRAREKLIILSTVKPSTSSDYGMTLNKIAKKLALTNENKIAAYSAEKTSNIAEWLMMCALLHPDMDQLRKDAYAEDIMPLPCKAEWKYEHIKNISQSRNQAEKEEHKPEIDRTLLELLKKRFTNCYPYKNRVMIPTKVSASGLTHQNIKNDFIASTVPTFALGKTVSVTARGTATHKILQYAELKKLVSDWEAEKDRLISQGYLSKEEAELIRNRDIALFTNSKIYQRMIHSQNLQKEYRFTVNIPASEVDKDFGCEDNVILQGAIDCLFEEPDGFVIVDYKTDYIKDIHELSENYSKQLELYKNAVNQLMNKSVKECIIYSLYLGEEIQV